MGSVSEKLVETQAAFVDSVLELLGEMVAPTCASSEVCSVRVTVFGAVAYPARVYVYLVNADGAVIGDQIPDLLVHSELCSWARKLFDLAGISRAGETTWSGEFAVPVVAAV